MKKTTLLAFAAALAMGTQIANAQQQQEVQYVEDTAQGLLINPMKDNWFITAEVGGSVRLTADDSKLKFGKRIAPAASIYVGKWFTPVFGARAGVTFFGNKGLSPEPTGAYVGEPTKDGLYRFCYNHIGPVADLMVNLTNWWCGYNPNRVYNLTAYVGPAGYFTFEREATPIPGQPGKYEVSGYKDARDFELGVRAGLLNTFRLSKHFQLNLDIRYAPVDDHKIETTGTNRTASNVQAFLGLTYNFGKTTWNAPVVPICPEPENCDALRARLQAADNRIADLERQLKDCMSRPVEKVVVENKAPLSTVYFPIGVSKLSNKDINVLKAVAEVMKSSPNTKYTLTGWADNYTGNDRINTRLRNQRAESVERQLVRFGVPASQLKTAINAGNLCDLGEKYVALDRAVTIEETK